MGKDILIIIPAHNEEGRIGQVIKKIEDVSLGFDILVVDDGSVDGTRNEAVDSGAEVISLPFNLGYGSALETGYIYAKERGYEYVAQMDGDGQHEPANLNDLFDFIKNDRVDIAIGSRFLKNCGYKPSLARKIGMIIFAKITSFLIKKKITDSTSGFQAINKKVLNFFTNGFYPSDYPDADVLIILNNAGFRIAEIPVIMYSSQGKKSMHRGLFKPFYYIFKMFLSISMIYLRKKTDQ